MTLSPETEAAVIRDGNELPDHRDEGQPRPVRNRRQPSGLVAGSAIILFFIVLALLGPNLVPYDPFDQALLERNQAPSLAHWLGTDNYGRDVLARLVYGARLTFLVGLGGVACALLFGAGLGLSALAFGRWLTFLVFGLIDFVRSLPDVLFALILIVALGPGLTSVVLALGISFAPYFAYIARAAWRREMAADYIAAARTLGATRWRILHRHAWPNIAGGLITLAGVVLPRCIVTESVLSFLGLGVSPDTPTWGRMIAEATAHFEDAPHAVIAPVLALCVLTCALAVVGNHARSLADPLRASAARSEVG